MGRKVLKALVLEMYPGAVCKSAFHGGVFTIRHKTQIVGEGHSKKTAWRNAAERLTQ